MNLLAPTMTDELDTRDTLRLLNVFAARLHAALDVVEGDFDDDEGDTGDDRRGS